MEGDKDEKIMPFLVFFGKIAFVKKQEKNPPYPLLFVIFINATHKNGKVHTHKRTSQKRSFFAAKKPLSAARYEHSLAPN